MNIPLMAVGHQQANGPKAHTNARYAHNLQLVQALRAANQPFVRVKQG